MRKARLFILILLNAVFFLNAPFALSPLLAQSWTIPSDIIIFEDGFEGGISNNNFIGWDGTTLEGSGNITVEPTIKTDGRYAALFNCPNGSGSLTPPVPLDRSFSYKQFTFPSGNVLWAKTKFRFDGQQTSLQFGGGFLMQFALGPGYYQQRWNVEFYSPSQVFDRPNTTALPFTLHGSSHTGWMQRIHSNKHTFVEPDTWYEVKIKMDYTGTYPVASYWLNGVYQDSLEDTTTLSGDAVKPNFVHIGCPWWDVAAREKLYIDQFGIYSVDPDAVPPSGTVLEITDISDNSATYPNSQIPKFEKYEVNFQVNNSVAANLQLPYDANPPAGITPGIGISVNAEFSQDNFQTVYTQPAFYYQDFDYQQKSGRDWIYPSNNFSWKARFAPDKEGAWQYRIAVQDASGTVTSSIQSFTVTASPNNHGFIKVSPKDPRYFEYDDGTYFPGLGYNMNFDHISWNNPVLGNQNNFQIMGQNGIQVIRHWLSQWGIFGASGNPWRSLQNGSDFDWFLGFDSRVPLFKPASGSDLSMVLQWQYNHTMFLGWMKNAPAVKPNTNYHAWVKYLIPADLTGPRIAGHPYGLVLKNAITWLDHPEDPENPSLASDVTINAYSSPKDAQGDPQWSTVEGSFNSGNRDFLNFIYLTLENVTDQYGSGGGIFAYIDKVEIKEDLGNGQYGPDILDRPWMDMHRYFAQEYSYRFDKVLELARQNNVYLKLVGLEKNDYIFNEFDYNGNQVQAFTGVCGNNACFYGNWGAPTKLYWLQQAWWRYMQARWGYSTNIHSWELLNEGDPFNGLHHTLANNHAKFMHQWANPHMVTTSNWHSFPRNEFWGNPNYKDLDYADLHQYIGDTDAGFSDTAKATYDVSALYGAKSPNGANKPVMRGETGLYSNGNTNAIYAGLYDDTQGIWLHKYTWGQINPGGLIESYWYDTQHIYNSNPPAPYAPFDHRGIYGAYYSFIKDIPLSNGNYVDAQATSSNPNIRAWGQKDAVGGKAYLWIDNKNHTWKNVVDGVAIAPESGTVTFSGMPQGNYAVSWIDTYSEPLTLIRTEQLVVGSLGIITLNVLNLDKDIAVKLSSVSVAQIPGDVNNDASINVLDIQACVNHILGIQNFGNRADVNGDGSVDVLDVQNIVNIILGA